MYIRPQPNLHAPLSNSPPEVLHENRLHAPNSSFGWFRAPLAARSSSAIDGAVAGDFHPNFTR